MSGPALFSDLDCISPQVVSVLHAQSFVRATPVQEAVLPLFCSHKDVAVDAATGSGKTLAFILPIVERLRSAKPGLLDVRYVNSESAYAALECSSRPSVYRGATILLTRPRLCRYWQ